MALQSKKNEKPIEEQVSLDLGLEVEKRYAIAKFLNSKNFLLLI